MLRHWWWWWKTTENAVGPAWSGVDGGRRPGLGLGFGPLVGPPDAPPPLRVLADDLSMHSPSEAPGTETQLALSGVCTDIQPKW